MFLRTQAGQPPCQPLVLVFVAQVAASPCALWWGGGCLGEVALCPQCSSPVSSHRTAACSTPRGSASPVFRRISVLSLRKYSRMWKREKGPPRSPPAIPDWQAHSLLCSVGLTQPGFRLGDVYLASPELWSTCSPGNQGAGQA